MAANFFGKSSFYALHWRSFFFWLIGTTKDSLFADLLLRLQDSAIAYANIIYSENIVLPDFVQYGLVSCYLASAIGGILFEASEKKRRWKIVVLSFAPAFFVALAETSKGLMFLCSRFSARATGYIESALAGPFSLSGNSYAVRFRFCWCCASSLLLLSP